MRCLAIARNRLGLVAALVVVLASACTTDDQAGDGADVGAGPDAGVHAVYQTLNWCGNHPLAAPSHYFSTLHQAAAYMSRIPDGWGSKGTVQGRCMSKIACRESDWRPHASNGSYIGMYQLNRSYFPMGEATYKKYWHGGRDRHGVWRRPRFWQSYAAFRYILSRSDYKNPCDGWASERSRGWW